MSRYIDADAVISFVDAGHLRNPMELSWTDKDVVDMIESRPTVDSVPVVRCKECKKRYTPWCFAHRHGESNDNFYCADGERRTE